MEGLRLKQFREWTKKTQTQMAEFLQVPVSTYNKYEQGKLRVADEVRAALFNLGLDINWLLTGEGEMFLPTGKERETKEKPSLGYLEEVLASKEELGWTDNRVNFLEQENAQLKERLGEQDRQLKATKEELDRRISQLEQLAKKYLGDSGGGDRSGNRGYSPMVAKRN